MKKFIQIMMIIILALGVSACKKEAPNNKEVKKVAVVQIVQHASLNEIRDSFVAEMTRLGYEEGNNIIYDFKDAANQQNNLNTIISTIVNQEQDALLAIATPTALCAANYADQIPTLFAAVSDPVQVGLVNDMQHPDLGMSGTSDAIAVDKILDLAMLLDPNLKTLGFIYNSSELHSVHNLEKTKAYCNEHDLQLQVVSGTNISEIQNGISVLTANCDAIFAPNDNTVASSMQALTSRANERKIPVYTGADSMVYDGGLATVGINYTKLGQANAKMMDQVLKGKAMKDIAVKVFDDDLMIYINEDTLKTLGINLPDEVKNDEKVVFVKTRKGQ